MHTRIIALSMAIVLPVFGLTASTCFAQSSQSDNLERGKAVFASSCSSCHSISSVSSDGLAPNLRGVVGRIVGERQGFLYSETLKQLGAQSSRWDEALLRRYIADPEATMPGTDMKVRLRNQASVDAVIEYLRTIK